MEDRIVKETASGQMDLDSMLKDMEEWTRRCLRMAGSQYTHEFTHEPFPGNKALIGHSLKIDKEGWFQGAITIYQGRDGVVKCDVDRMLGGRWAINGGLTAEDWKVKLQDAIERILGRRINMDRESLLVTDPVIARNYRDDYYITCSIDGQKQLRKPLKDDDRKDYVQKCYNCSEYYIDEFKFELAEKYFKTELALARDRSESRGIGR